MRLSSILYIIAAMTLIGTAYSESITSANYTYAQANGIIANATSYVNLINSSSYLIFNPNLTMSYLYLNQATNIYQSSPSAAVTYAYKAQSSAQEQYDIIQTYKKGSTYIVTALALVSLAILYVLMKPIRLKVKKM